MCSRSLPASFRIDEVRHAEALAPFLLTVVDVDTYVMSAPAARLMTLSPMPPSPKTAFGAGFYLGGVEDGDSVVTPQPM